MPLGDDLRSTLLLQRNWTSDPKDEAMRRRRTLVERAIPDWIREQPLPSGWASEGSGGKGAPAEIPWSRVYAPEFSPKAGVGWYLVYLFAADGSAVYLSLNQGTTTWDTERKDFRFRSNEDLTRRVEWARRESIERPLNFRSNRKLLGKIELHARGRLGKAYEIGNVWSLEYRSSDALHEPALASDFQRMMELLERLYERDTDVPRASAFFGAVPDIEDMVSVEESAEVIIQAPVAEARAAAVAPTVTAGDQRRAFRVPAIADDGAVGPDRLGVARDARALAGLIASKSLKPPLAVAVYGEWGSGKTFFMNQIETSIGDLTRRDPEVFEPAIKHVHFGAWHYARGNLWASILSHIFSTLCPPKSSTDKMLENVAQQIETIEATLEAAKKRVKALEGQSRDIRREIATKMIRHKKIQEELRSVRAKDIWTKVTADPELRNEFENAIATLGIDVAGKGARDLLEAARTVTSLGSRTRVLATARTGKCFATSPLGGAVVAAVVGTVLMSILAVAATDSLKALGTFITSFGTVASGVAAWILNQAKAARQLLEPAERLQQQIELRVEQARIEQAAEIEALEARDADVQALLAVARELEKSKHEELVAAEQARKELTPEHLLQEYLAERVASGEYDKHLGVIGVVHRDLLALSEHLRRAADDPDSSIKRIVLYIDDLDRCTPKTVVEVLEAVHLLLALDLFVVVVGVNRRVVDRSLRVHLSDLIDEQSSQALTPADYLEKIFQLGYTLPAMSTAGCREILRGAVGRSIIQPVGAAELGAAEADVLVDDDVDEELNRIDAPEVDEGLVTQTFGGAEELTMVVEGPNEASDQEIAEALTLDSADLKILDGVAPLVATTPRRAKRFLSVYLVVRARVANEPFDAAVLAVAVAILVGLPGHFSSVLRLPYQEGYVDMTVGEWIKQMRSNADSAESVQASEFLDTGGSLLEIHMKEVLAQRALVILYAS
ncbi:MrcB family domain-containing protein [Nocardia sp. CA-151230]|uniref:MrcB family domain-containing protein n=1 Tax=Nocardia sp. CA-151230 TaxID=3239982 RepID=UPI003D8A27D0